MGRTIQHLSFGVQCLWGRSFSFTTKDLETEDLRSHLFFGNEDYVGRVHKYAGNVTRLEQIKLTVDYKGISDSITVMVITGDRDIAFDSFNGLSERAILWVGTIVGLWWKLYRTPFCRRERRPDTAL